MQFIALTALRRYKYFSSVVVLKITPVKMFKLIIIILCLALIALAALVRIPLNKPNKRRTLKNVNAQAAVLHHKYNP